MAKILPNPITGYFPPAVLDVYRALKAIPGENLTVWVGLPLPGAESKPDFLVVTEDHRVIMVAVGQEGEFEFEQRASLSLFNAEEGQPAPGQKESAKLRDFFWTGLASSEPAEEERTATGLVIFPYVSQSLLDQMPEELRPRDVFLLGRQYCQAVPLRAFLEQEAPAKLPVHAIQVLRSAFNPESVVPPSFCYHRPTERNLKPSLTTRLLDYEQEHWAKRRLLLSLEAAQATQDIAGLGNAALVTGVAGSGKTLVLLCRACMQAKLLPHSSSLVLTHNRALLKDMSARFKKMGSPPNLQWHTFFSWIRLLISRVRPFPSILQYSERDQGIAHAAQEYLGPLNSAQIAFFAQRVRLDARPGTGRGILLSQSRARRSRHRS